MTDRTPKPDAKHEHGNYVTYVADKCRCFPCSEANRLRALRQRRDKAYGRKLLEDAEPVRQHLLKLRALGLSIATIEKLSGASHCAVQELVYSSRTKVWPITAKRILAVPLEPLPVEQQPPGRFISAIGARRRVQALCTIGWSLTVIGARVGLDKRTMQEISWRNQCTVATHLKIVALYDELWDQQPPGDTAGQRVSATKARSHAKKQGWAPPMAWDDDDIDDPNATPNTGDAQRDAESREAERLALWKRGMTDRQIAAATGWHRDSVRRWRLRHGLPSQERRAAS